MQFPPIDEPTIKAVNDVIRHCESARRLFKTALETNRDETLAPLLCQSIEAHARIVAALHEGLFDTAGAASRVGTVKGLVRRLKERIGQRTGWRDRRQLLDALVDQQRRTLDAIDAALDGASGDRIAAMLSAQRTVVAGLTAQLESMTTDV